MVPCESRLTHVQANKRQFATLGDARSDVEWRRAVDELDVLRLVEDRAGRRALLRQRRRLRSSWSDGRPPKTLP